MRHSWPDGFLWGTGASSTQCEGAAPASDWWDWERAGHAPISGDGNGFGTRYAEDFALLADLGLRDHRLSIEWARIEPADGERDDRAVAHYRDVLTAALDAGIEPWVTLHHFTLPRWFADVGGFAYDANRTGAWARHVDFMAETFGDLVRGWKPVNETNYYASAVYLGRGWPPGRDDFREAMAVSEQIHLAAAEAAVRLKQTGAPVSSIFGLSDNVLLDDEPRSRSLKELLDAMLWDAGLGLQRDGVLRLPGRDPVERPDLAGTFDLLGFSYYTTVGIRDGRMAPYPPDAPVSPLGYGIDANGLGLTLDRLAAAVPDTPLLIAEYGIGTDDDEQRAAYLADGLRVTREALDRGVDVRGFFHWTAVDNYEWLHGYDVSFGIIDRDRNVRPSADVLRHEARATSPSGAAWQLGPFERTGEPILGARPDLTFRCPVTRRDVAWAAKDVFNPGAVVRDGRVHLLVRAEDDDGRYAGVSRLGLATSDDGLHFELEPEPVLVPDDDEWQAWEWPGGCEDPRVVESPDGGFVCTYTAFDGKNGALVVATSDDLRTWTKHGPAFAGTPYVKRTSKSGAIVTEVDDGRLVAARQADDRYWMYWGEGTALAATSDDLVQWTPVEYDATGDRHLTYDPAARQWGLERVPGLRVLRPILFPRRGRYDSLLVEPGPPAVATDDGIVLVTNGANHWEHGDPALAPFSYQPGQVLFDPADPAAPIARATEPFLRAEGAAVHGQVDNVCFAQGLVRFDDRWLLYVGMADSRIGVATTPA